MFGYGGFEMVPCDCLQTDMSFSYIQAPCACCGQEAAACLAPLQVRCISHISSHVKPGTDETGSLVRRPWGFTEDEAFRRSTGLPAAGNSWEALSSSLNQVLHDVPTNKQFRHVPSPLMREVACVACLLA